MTSHALDKENNPITCRVVGIEDLKKYLYAPLHKVYVMLYYMPSSMN